MAENTTVNNSMFGMTSDSSESPVKTVLKMSDYSLLAELESKELHSTNAVAVVFLAIIMVIGTIGNLHAVLVYFMYYVSSNRRTFILWLAVVDLLNCVFMIPFSMHIAINKYTVTSNFLCKFFYFLGSFLSGFSLLLMDIIAVDRLRKVAFPLKRQIQPKQVNIINGIAGTICLILTVPLLIIKCAKLVPLPGGLVGSMCKNDYSSPGRIKLAQLNGLMMLVLFLIFCLLCVILYCVIICVLQKYNYTMSGGSSRKSSNSGSLSSRKGSWISLRLKRKGSVSSAKSSDDTEAEKPEPVKTNKLQQDNIHETGADITHPRQISYADTNVTSLDRKGDTNNEATSMTPRPRGPLQTQDSRVTITSQSSTRRIKRGKRTTMIFLVASLISCFGFLPNFSIIIYSHFFSKNSGVHGLGVLEPARRILMALSYITSVVNPIVYCFLDRKFRLECKRFYGRMKKKLT